MHRLKIGILLLVMSIVSFAYSQDPPNDIHQATNLPSEARFQILQSELAAKWTFRLDRFTGRVSQLVTTKNGDYTWQDMKIVLPEKPKLPAHAKYQLFASGLSARFTFLIDTDTGMTWQVEHSKEHLSDGTDQDDDIWVPLN